MSRKFKVTAFAFALVSGAATSGTTPVNAQQWPTRTVKFVVPFAPGAAADIGARLAAERLQKIWPQSVIVENRPGGDSLIAIRQIIGANDDHQMYFGPTGNFTPHPYKQEKRGYDRKTELLPVGRFSNTLLGLAVATYLKVNTVKEFVDLAKANPGKMNVVGVPGITGFVWDGFVKTVDVNITKVPYTNFMQGANDMSTDRVQASLASLTVLQPCMQGNVCKLIAVTGRERMKMYPDVPTAAEAGFPSLELEGLVGAFGPKAMSLELRRRIGDDIAKVASDPELAQRLAASGQASNPGGTDEFTKSVEDQEESVARTAKLLGLPRLD